MITLINTQNNVLQAMEALKNLDEMQTTDLLSKDAQQIKVHIENNDLALARDKAKLLCKRGIGLINEEVKNESRFDKTTVIRVITNMNEITSDDCLRQRIQSEALLHRPLSKAYRIFVELTWYQSHREGFSNLETTIDKIIQASKVRTLLSSKKLIKANFNYRCTEQAVTLLKLTNDAYIKKYATRIAELVKSITAREIGAFANAFLNFAIDLKKEYTFSWYLDTHYLHWVSASISKTQTFVEITDLKLEEKELKQKEGEYTLCLTTIFMDFIRRNLEERKTDSTVQIEKTAIEHLGVLAGLKNGWFLARFDFDKFKETRLLAKYYLSKMGGAAPKYIDYKEESDKIFKKLSDPNCNQKIKDETLKDIKECQVTLTVDYKKLKNPGQPTKSIETSYDEANAKLEKEMKLKEEMKRCNEEQKKVESNVFLSRLEEIDREEKEDLENLLKQI